MATLKELRKKNALSQRELAQLTRLSPPTITRLEQGKHKPLPRTIRKLAKALKVQPSDIDFK